MYRKTHSRSVGLKAPGAVLVPCVGRVASLCTLHQCEIGPLDRPDKWPPPCSSSTVASVRTVCRSASLPDSKSKHIQIQFIRIIIDCPIGPADNRLCSPCVAQFAVRPHTASVNLVGGLSVANRQLLLIKANELSINELINKLRLILKCARQ